MNRLGPLVNWVKVDALLNTLKYSHLPGFSVLAFIEAIKGLKAIDAAALYVKVQDADGFLNGVTQEPDSYDAYNESTPLMVVLKQIKRNTVTHDRTSTNDAHRILSHICTLYNIPKFKRTDWSRYIRYVKTQQAEIALVFEQAKRSA